MSDESLLEFPCTFPIKVMGHNNDEVRDAVHHAANTHASDAAALSIVERSSRTGKYLSFTVTLTVQSKDQLDSLYLSFTQIDGVSMVL